MSGVALWLLLLSIFTHALAPSSASPVPGTVGSAFSAFADDVSLAPAASLPLQKSARLRAASGGGDDGDGLVSSAGIALLVGVAGLIAFGLAGRAQLAAWPLRPALRQADFLPLGARAPPAF